VELREETIFADMSADEVTQAIYFMRKLDTIRRVLEEEVSHQAPEARHTFIEFATSMDKPDKA